MRRKRVFALNLFVLLSLLLYVRFNPVEVEAPDSYPVHNLDTGLNYTTIQEAIDAPETLGGHTIFVENGTYYENVVVDKSVSVIGEDNLNTIINGRGATVITMSNDDVTVSGFTLENGSCGVYAGYLSNTTIEECNILNCTNGINVRGDANKIRRNLIMNVSEIGVRIWHSNNSVVDNEIIGNGCGTGVYLRPWVLTGECIGNKVVGNNITRFSDAIDVVLEKHVSVGGNTITGNVIKHNIGTGIVLGAGGNNVSNNEIVQNGDCGIHCRDSNWVLANEICGNNGSAIVFSPKAYGSGWPSSAIVSKNVIMQNKGYGVYVSDYNAVISENNISNNSGGVYLIIAYASGMHVFHNNFVNNTDQAYVWNLYGGKVAWDDGYPSGGNGWSDYPGVDDFSGPDQNATGSDGIGDTPYVIDENNQDRYPLMNVVEPHGPKAEFTATHETARSGEPVEFNATGSLPGWNGTHTMPITEYRWNFGDGNTTSTVDPTIVHTYAFPGTFNVTLTVLDSEGLNSSCSVLAMIQVVMPTFVSISTSSPSTFVGYKVNISGTLSDIYGSGLESETVVLYYTFSGISTWTPITSDTTDNLGYYQAVWIPPATGYFIMKVEWIGNTTHLGTNNTTTLSSLAYDDQYVFAVESNSTISELAFNTTNWQFSFTATGPNGTKGYVKVTVAKSLVANITNIRVYLNGNQTECSITSRDDSWLLTLNYTHSTHQVVIDLDINIIPEFSSLIILPLFMIATLLAVIVHRRKHTR